MTQIKLGNYKGIEIPKIVVEVGEDELTAELERARQMAAEWLNVEKAEDGDEVLIDFEGFLDGVPFEGGKGEKYPLTLGSGSFIPGFEEQLLNSSKGDDVDVVVTFPEEYQADNLAGKETTFKVKVHNVRRQMIPELDDALAAKVSHCNTLEEFKSYVENAIREQKVEAAKQEAAKKQLLEICEAILEEEELEALTDEFVDNMRGQLQAYGMQLEDYLQMAGSTLEDLKAENKVKAEEMLKCTKILEEIAKEQNIQATEDEVKAQIEALAQQYQMSVADIEATLSDEGKESVADDIKLGKAFQFVLDNCTEI